ncbi:hypothetical protein [Deinococcus arcticus]|uniref:Uncharacterized protein n=1 Tax=Deinococcus arcticus TaxID=2136176 RepID=A0A2T3W7G3_9DEIO|nr:hypothetical protein [Deinococcus arcticus]PTA67724.1 hypothetical protein C8263_11475 [Deinococcus arcticus]
MNVLNIELLPGLAARWRAWLAPARQPFFLTAAEVQTLGLNSEPRADAAFPPEARDTFTLWAVAPGADQVVWLDRADWANLASALQRTLLRAQVRHGRGNLPLGRAYADLLPGLPRGRFLWHPDHLGPAVLTRWVEQDGLPCQRAQVPEAVWAGAAALLPGAQALAGTFPDGSAGNCFGAVMGAAGVPGAAQTWMQRAPFEAFLQAHTRPGGHDDQPGTVLVWRSRDGLAQHTAVTLGGGWALHKAAQTWWTPRVVLPVAALKRVSRSRGQRLERRRLVGPD